MLNAKFVCSVAEVSKPLSFKSLNASTIASLEYHAEEFSNNVIKPAIVTLYVSPRCPGNNLFNPTALTPSYKQLLENDFRNITRAFAIPDNSFNILIQYHW